MKRIHILGTVSAIVLVAAIVPPLVLSGPSDPPAVAAVTPTPYQGWDTGITHALGAWYEAKLDYQAHLALWYHRRHYLRRRAYLEHLQDVAQVRAYDRWKAAQAPPAPPPPVYYPPPVTTTTQPYVAPPSAPSYGGDGYVDPASLPYPWSCIVSHESNGYNVTNYGSGADGYFQFLPSTWQALGYSGTASEYSFATQYAAAQQLYAQQGISPWSGDGC